MERVCKLAPSILELLTFAMADLNLSARAYDRVLKVARTIADLAGAAEIAGAHISVAMQLRSPQPAAADGTADSGISMRAPLDTGHGVRIACGHGVRKQQGLRRNAAHPDR